MQNRFLLQGIAKWSYDHELAKVSATQKVVSGMVSFTPPLHYHTGNIALSNQQLILEGINGDEDLTVALDCLQEVYLGFDELFPANSVKSLGIFWQPLRVRYLVSAFEAKSIYLVIDFNGMFTHDKDWFKALSEILA